MSGTERRRREPRFNWVSFNNTKLSVAFIWISVCLQSLWCFVGEINYKYRPGSLLTMSCGGVRVCGGRGEQHVWDSGVRVGCACVCLHARVRVFWCLCVFYENRERAVTGIIHLFFYIQHHEIKQITQIKIS